MRMLLLALLLSGCAAPKPWVSPWERAQLAEPWMSLTPDPVSASYMHHVHQVREGGRGAEGGDGGGCGCN